MNREWLTLAFGILLVSGVAVVSVWQNYPSTRLEVEAQAAPVEGAEPENAEAAANAGPAATGPKPARKTAPAAPAPKATVASGRVDARAETPSSEVRPGAPLPVVHKHRFGDCEGTLSATPGALTYTTANKEDGFRLTFAEVEAFELATDKKQLRVRRRGGRTWNFTVPGDNSVALDAFYQQAEKTRR